MSESEKTENSLTKTLAKGFLLTAVSGALMAGIFMGFSALIPTASLGSFGVILLTTVATGTFGAILQGISYFRKKADKEYAANSLVNPRDIAITAASNGLIMTQNRSSNLAQSIDNPQLSTSYSPQAASQSQGESHFFRDRLNSSGHHMKLNEKVNSILSGKNTALNYQERIDKERETAALMPQSPTIH